MTIYSVFVINKAGGLIFQYDHHKPVIEMEKTFGFPLELKLEEQSEGITVIFGQRDGIRVGHIILSINGKPVQSGKVDGIPVMETISKKENYPLSIKFGRPKLSSNQKIMLASMFHSLYAISVQLSPKSGSSGIEKLETDVFTLHCKQTLTGVKFVVISDNKQVGVDTLLNKLYHVYSDYALKNPFYSLEMPIRAEQFDNHVKATVEKTQKTGSAY
ncbi:trafficking protein particle complex subunit 4-like [Styela clava]|uniref:trafficking protein particle complex subunit 4-like n=1 Tax=Styela clava TaxID=7725 RepID=UPI0019395A30|nr:trafficking protein particle complex subunit 4-like [Styela clava]